MTGKPHVATLLSLVICFWGPAPLQSADRVDSDAKPVFKDGEAQVVRAFSDSDYWIRHDLWVETDFDSDGDGSPDRMHVSVTRPGQTESGGLKLPAIYVTSPYFSGTGDTGDQFFWNVRQELGAEPPDRVSVKPVKQKVRRPIISKSHLKEWVPRGYAVVHSCSPGTGLSQGCPTIGGDNEALAPKAVIEWLTGKRSGYTRLDGDETVSADWCTGKVGMTGTSFNGTLCLAAATTGVEGLEAIIPIAPNTSYYHYYRSNGLVRHPYGYLGEDIDYLFDYVHSGDPSRREYCDCEVRDKVMLEKFDRANGDYNDFWRGRDYLHKLDEVRAAVLMAHAFNDWNVVPEHSVRILDALREKGVTTQSYFHQGGHGGPPPMKQMNRWFTRFLHGVDNDVEKDPQSWVVREGDQRESPTSYARYPHPDATPVRLGLVGGAPTKGELVMEKGEESRRETLVDNFSFDGASLAQAEWTEHRLIYVTAPLKKPVHLSGTPRIIVRMACDRPAANLSVWLVSLPWNDSSKAKITDNVITRGWADPKNRNSIESEEPLVPGTFYDVSFDLQPDDQLIPKGQQIGLMIFSSDKDFTLHPNPGARITVETQGTSLWLPVVGGEKALKESLEPAGDITD